MNPKLIASEMLKNDSFSRWLGVEILEIGIGKCKVGMTIRKEMINGMGKAHGGISFSLADTALAIVSNIHGTKAVSIEASINHIEALEIGDYITAEATFEKVKSKLGFNIITVRRHDELVALFKGVVYRTKQEW